MFSPPPTPAVPEQEGVQATAMARYIKQNQEIPRLFLHKLHVRYLPMAGNMNSDFVSCVGCVKALAVQRAVGRLAVLQECRGTPDAADRTTNTQRGRGASK